MNQPRHNPAGRMRCVAGFSLIELTVALALSAVVMLALGSAIVLASRALPDAGTSSGDTLAVARVLDRLTGELQHAVHVAEYGTHAITFAVPDRTGDHAPHRIRYAWSGTPGDPLTWQLDDHDPVALLPAVESFELTYAFASHSETYPGPVTESSAGVVSQYAPANNENELSIQNTRWLSQPVIPELSPDAVSWRPTAVSYRARQPLLSLLSGNYAVELWTAELDGRPAAPMHAQMLERPSNLSLLRQWRTVDFGTTSSLLPGQPVHLAFRYAGSGGGTAFYLEHDGSGPGAGGVMRTDDAGGTWYARPDGHRIPHYLYATQSIAGPDQGITRQHLRRVGFELQAEGDNRPVTAGSVHLLNSPAVLSRFWELDFRHDPTAVDANADGINDWQMVGGGGFATAQLSNGSWHASQTIRSRPNESFTTPSVMNVRMRHNQADGGMAMTWLYAHRSDGLVGPVGAGVQRQGDGTQHVVAATLETDGSVVELGRSTGHAAGWLDIRSIVSPDHQTVHVRVNGESIGTYPYNRISTSTADQSLHVMGYFTDHAEFQYVRLSVGGSTP